VGLVAQSGSYFPGLVPGSLAPLLGNSVAVGGFTAFGLSAVAWLLPKRSVGGTFPARVDVLPEMQRLLEAGRARLGLSRESFNALSLCCEESYCHMAGKTGPADRFLTIALAHGRRRLHGIDLRAQDGRLNNFALPRDCSTPTRRTAPARHGLFAGYARDVKHIEISGYSFISFLTP
jgi:hypothetical protein